MARGRMLNQKISEDEQFNAMSIEAQFMFMRVIPFLDRDGLITGHPILLQSRAVPLLPDFAAKMPAIIAEWVEAELVISYNTGKTAVLFFKGFSKNNNIHYARESASPFPPPPGYYRNGNGLEPIANDQSPDEGQDSGNHGGDVPPVIPNAPSMQDDYIPTPDEVRMKSGLSPDEIPLEVKVEVEVKGESIDTGSTAREAVDNPVAAPPNNFDPEPLRKPGWKGKQKTGHRVRSASCTYFDPRKLVGGFVPKETGENGTEAYFEFHAFDNRSPPSKTAMEQMNEITDLAKWRQVLEKCTLAGWKPGNIGDRLDAYRNGFRHEQKAQAQAPPVISGAIGFSLSSV